MRAAAIDGGEGFQAPRTPRELRTDALRMGVL